MFINYDTLLLLLSTIILNEKYWKFSGKIEYFLGKFFCPTALTSAQRGY